MPNQRYRFQVVNTIFKTPRNSVEFTLPLILSATDRRTGNLLIIVVIQCRCATCKESLNSSDRQFLVAYYCFTKQEAEAPLALLVAQVAKYIDANRLILWKTWEDACTSILDRISSEEEDIQEGRAITLRAWLNNIDPL